MNEKSLVSIIEKVRNGFGVERTNIDLKRRWWRFDKPSDYNEFLKDICAMANTQNGDSHIILGVDEKGKVFNAPLPEDEGTIQSRHKDAIEPRIKMVINEYDIEDKTVSVITIPHSKNRPHMIKKYKDNRFWIPVRFGSSTLTATRSDLDEMYNERDRSTESALHVRLYEDDVYWGFHGHYGGCSFLVRLTIDNYSGGAPDYLVNARLRPERDQSWRTEHFLFEGYKPNEELKIGSHERQHNVHLYVGLDAPFEDKNCPMPEMIDNQLKLKLYARSGKEFEMPIKREWIKEA
jgi:hypothetical protein